MKRYAPSDLLFNRPEDFDGLDVTPVSSNGFFVPRSKNDPDNLKNAGDAIVKKFDPTK